MTTSTFHPEPIGKARLTIDPLDSIRSHIAAYAGGPAIARELIQNADDAKADSIEFCFSDERLIVKNNSRFTEKDFDAILKIGSGSKRADQESTGTWGTGFLSVYQITDRPVICSAGRMQPIDPTGNEIEYYSSDIKDQTEFRFSWRKSPTLISEQIEADVWTPERIQKFKLELVPEIYRALPFLRNIKRITVSDTQGDLCQVVRKKMDEEILADGSCFERWNFTTIQRGQSGKIERWYFYCNRLPQGFEFRGKIVKSPDYAIAIGPRENTTGENLSGTLYNYLPTEIVTGFNFHIQGDFFPDANRKSILKGDGTTKSEWNERVLQGIAKLFANNVLHLRNQIAPTQGSTRLENFYRLLPISYDPRHPFLAPIVEAFRQVAANLPLAYTTDEKWTTPGNLRWTGNSKFRLLVEEYLPGIAPQGFPTELFNFLKEIGARELKGADFTNFIRQNVVPGTNLTNAHPVVNSREKLEAIYNFLIKDIALNVAQQEWLLQHLTPVPLCLDTEERLWTFEQKPNLIFRAEAVTRSLLTGGKVMLVDASFQNIAHSILKEKLPEFGAVEMVEYLQGLKPSADNVLVSTAPPVLNTREKLQKICIYLLERRVFEHFHSSQLGDLPLVLDESHRLRTVSADLYLADTSLRALLKGAEIGFIAAEIELNESWSKFLVQAGMRRLTASRLIIILGKLYPTPRPQGEAPKHFGHVAFLKELYRYFSQSARDLTEEDITRLCQVPFVLTQNGNLAALKTSAPLFLPPASGNIELQSLAEILKLDYLVSSEILDENLRNFFKNRLRTPELDTVEYIGKYLCPNYNNRELSHKDRLELLYFIQRAFPQLRNTEQGRRVLVLLRQIRLIRCQDDEYRLPDEVYFPDEVLSKIFPYGYSIPHACYLQWLDEPKPERQPLEHSPWQPLFVELGVRDLPEAASLVEAVRESVKRGFPVPDSQSYIHVNAVYEFLNQRWEQIYQSQAETFAPLVDLRWLPAEGDSSRWYAPEELFWARNRPLVESQVKILPFAQSVRGFSDFLHLNVDPRLPDVLAHLLWLGCHNQPPANAIYAYLNESRHRDRPELDRLKTEAVIYDHNSNRYWRPDKVFMTNLYQDFGNYRLYLPADNIGDWQSLYRRLGVRTQPDTVKDYNDLLLEIVRKAGSNPLAEEDRALVIRAYERLSSSLPNERTKTLLDWVKALREEAIVLDEEGRLYPAEAIFFDDSEVLKAKFEAGSLTLTRPSKNGQPFLIALGVRPLTEVVERVELEISKPVPSLRVKTHLQILKPQFERLIEHYKRRYGEQGWQSPEWVDNVQVYEAQIIKVRYQIPLSNSIISGSVLEEEAFYNKKTGKLYLKTIRSGEYFKALAPELVTIVNPLIDRSMLLSTLRELLKSNLQGDAAHKLLDELEISRLPYQQYNYTVDEEAKKQSEAQVRSNEPTPVPEVSEDAPYIPVSNRPVQTRFEGLNEPKPALDKVSSSIIAPSQAFPLEELSMPGSTHSVVIPVVAEVLPLAEPEIRQEAVIAPVIKIAQGLLEPTIKSLAAKTEQAVNRSEHSEISELTTQPEKKALPNSVSKNEPDKAISIPPFEGEVRPIVPHIPTDYSQLRKKYGGLAKEISSEAELQEQERIYAASQQPEWDEPDEAVDEGEEEQRVDEVKFVLSFMMRSGGFLPLTKRAKVLLKGQPRQILCSTEFEQEFPLYIDNRRNIIYNQEVLPNFFEAQELPAGAIIRLSRVHANNFRLYYKHDPHTVQGIRIADLDESGKVSYVHLDEVEVPCETKDTVFIADKRLEDPAALFAEAYGKKSVFETIIAVFELNKTIGKTQLTSQEICWEVFNIRMVSYYSVKNELRRQRCFKEMGEDCWQFDATLVSARPYDEESFRSERLMPVAKANKAQLVELLTQTKEPEFVAQEALVTSVFELFDESSVIELLTRISSFLISLQQEPVKSGNFLQVFREPFQDFVTKVNRLYHAEAQSQQNSDNMFGSTLENASILLSRLQEDAMDWQSQDSFTKILRELFNEALQHQLAPQTELKTILSRANVAIWEQQIRPLIKDMVEELSQQQAYGKAIKLLEFDQRYTGRNVAEQVKQFKAKQDAYEYYRLCEEGDYSPQEKVSLLMDALASDPNLTAARRLLDGQVQILLGEKLQEILSHAKQGQLSQVLAEFEAITALRQKYEPQLYNKAVLNNFNVAATGIFREVNQNLVGELGVKELTGLTRLYLVLPQEVQTQFRLDYINNLVQLSQKYLQNFLFIEATLAGEKALEVGQQLGWNNVRQPLVLQLKRVLADSYVELEMWDYCHIHRREVTKICSEKERQQEKQKEEFAFQKRNKNELELMNAHNKYLAQLKKVQQDKSEPYQSVSSFFLEKQINKEAKYLSNRG